MSTMKKCQVVMLPTEEKAPFVLMQMNEEPKTILRNYNLDIDYGHNDKYQHLYILSDEEIKEDDWQYCELHGVTKAKNLLWSKQEGCKKIIATTDSSLLLESEEVIARSAGFKSTVPSYNLLPQPSQQFLEVFVKEYNKGNVIKEVMVQYETIPLIGKYGEDGHTLLKERLKINPKDNTITIKRVKDSWNREEVSYLLRNAMTEACRSKVINIDQWIEQNL